MKCSIRGCPGHYEAARILQTLRKGGEIVLIQHMPAEVCDVCGDTLIAPDTIRHIEKLSLAGVN